MRMPYDTRTLTDVKHLYLQGTIKNDRDAGGSTTEYPAYMGEGALARSVHPVYVGKSAVAPCLYTVGNGSMATGTVWASVWCNDRGGMGSTTTSADDYYVFSTNVSVRSGGAMSQWDPPANQQYMEADYIKPLTDAAGVGDLGSGYSLVPPPAEVLRTPTFHSPSKQAYYSLLHVPHLRLYYYTTVAVPNDMTLYCVLLRYNGLDQETCSDSIAITLSKGSKAAVLNLTDQLTTASGSKPLTCGYYRFRVDKIVMKPDPTLLMEFPPSYLRIVNLGYARSDRFWVQPTIPSFTDANYLYKSVRLTATALRVANRTPDMYKGGNVFVGKVFPDALADTPCGDGWYNVSLPKAMNDAAHPRTGYTGPANFGGYTWMELEEDDKNFRDCTAEFIGRGSVVVKARVDLDYFVRAQHIVLFDLQAMSEEAFSAFAGFFRVDTHIEYQSTSSLANLSVTAVPIQELVSANIVLAAAPLAYENPGHLSAIWGKIKQFAGPVLRAAGSAAARAALTSALATM